MAERIVRQLIDDFDGSEIPDGGGERVEFSLRGVSCQIDLSSANVAKLDKALKPYVDSAAKVGGTRARRVKSSSGKASKEQLSPAPGEAFSSASGVDFGVVKLDSESCP